MFSYQPLKQDYRFEPAHPMGIVHRQSCAKLRRSLSSYCHPIYYLPYGLVNCPGHYLFIGHSGLSPHELGKIIPVIFEVLAD